MAEELKANIEILKQQDYTNFEVYFGDDLSTDNSCEVIEENIKGDPRFHLIKHTEKLFSMGNIDKTITAAAPNDEDVIVLIDGDDKLSTGKVLSYLKDIYEEKDCLMTYGQYSVSGIKNQSYSDYPSWVKKLNLFRLVKWQASHLKTFKYKLWTKVEKRDLTITKEEFKSVLIKTFLMGKLVTWYHFKKVNYSDLVTEDYNYARRCSDKLLTSPMLELAGDKAIHIDEVLYHYNRQGIHNFGNSNKKWAQRFIRQSVWLKPRYKKINFGTK